MTTAWHQLSSVSERYIIVRGRGRVQIGDADPVEVAEGDVVRIPAGTPQRIEDIGKAILFFMRYAARGFEKRAMFGWSDFIGRLAR